MGRKNKLAAPPPARSKRVVLDPPMSPAIITPDMVQDRGYKGGDGKISQNKAWRRKSPLHAAYDKNQLSGGGKPAAERLAAGLRYADLFDLSEKSGRDSTQALNMSGRGGAGGGTLSQAQSDAMVERIEVERRMGARDRTIIRLVCGEGYQLAHAVKEACGDGYKFTVAARFRESLDSLIEAFDERRATKRSSSKKVA